MIVCHNCKSQEPDGAIFCSECGAILVQTNSIQTQKFSTESLEPVNEINYPNQISKESDIWISLHLLDSGHILAFSERLEFTLGRFSENEPIEPDVDLTPYKAFENGVSRLHAVIRSNDNQVIMIDLGSANGTYINGIRAMPNTDHPLCHGDIVALGKLKFQIILP